MVSPSTSGNSRIVYTSPRFLTWTVLLSLLSLYGCGANDGKLPVSGRIEKDGQPVAQATIAFLSENGASMASAITDADGRFRARVAPGKNKISISKMTKGAVEATAAATGKSDEEMVSPTDAELAKLRRAQPAGESWPAHLTDPNKSGLECEVASGMQPVEIRL